MVVPDSTIGRIDYSFRFVPGWDTDQSRAKGFLLRGADATACRGETTTIRGAVISPQVRPARGSPLWPMTPREAREGETRCTRASCAR